MEKNWFRFKSIELVFDCRCVRWANVGRRRKSSSCHAIANLQPCNGQVMYGVDIVGGDKRTGADRSKTQTKKKKNRDRDVQRLSRKQCTNVRATINFISTKPSVRFMEYTTARDRHRTKSFIIFVVVVRCLSWVDISGRHLVCRVVADWNATVAEQFDWNHGPHRPTDGLITTILRQYTTTSCIQRDCSDSIREWGAQQHSFQLQPN